MMSSETGAALAGWTPLWDACGFPYPVTVIRAPSLCSPLCRQGVHSRLAPPSSDEEL